MQVQQLLDRCDLRAHLMALVERQAGWVRLWGAALDYGVSHTRGLQLLSRVLSHHLLVNNRWELGLIQETDLELIARRLVNLDINFFS